MSTEGQRLRAYLGDLYGSRYGWVSQLARDTQLDRKTLYAWFNGTPPDLASLGVVASRLGVTRAEIVAAMDGTDFPAALPARLREGMRAFLEAAQAEGLVPAPPSRSEQPTARRRRSKVDAA